MAKPISGIRIRRATVEDAEVCGCICYDAFTTINRQHNFPPELPAPDAAIGVLRRLFSHPGFFCVVAELIGRASGVFQGFACCRQHFIAARYACTRSWGLILANSWW